MLLFRDFKETLSTVLKNAGLESDIKLSSAGLIYCHFGKKIIKHLIPEVSEDGLQKIFRKGYENLIQEVDGIDNGVQMFDGEPKYNIISSYKNVLLKHYFNLHNIL